MALISANFTADFSKFQTAVEGAQAKMKNFESEAGNVAKAMTTMENSISGVKIQQAATIAAEAVERLGGVSKLTYGELQKLGNTAQEAVDKFKAMGQAVPTNIQSLADHARGAAEDVHRLSERQTAGQSSAMNWSGALSMATGALGALGINATISGVVDFTKEVIASANAIHDMAEKLNISAEAVQGFKGAAEKSGSSIDTVSSAILKLNKNLAEGDASTVEALDKMGLKFADVRGMKIEDAFITVGDAAAKMTDEMEQTRSGTDLMGQGFAELLPMMKSGTREVADSVEKMSDETIASLARAKTAWDEYSNHVKVVTGTVLAGFADAAAHATKSTSNFTQFLLDAIKFGPGVAMSLGAMNEQLEQTAGYYGPIQEIAKVIGKTKAEIDAAKKASDDWKAAMVEINAAGDGWRGTLDTIDGTVVEAIKYYLEAGVSQGALATAYGLTAVQVKAVDAAMKDAIATQKNWDELAKKQAEFNQKGMEATAEHTKKKTAEVNATVIDGNTQIMNAEKALRDFQRQQSMDTTSYQVVKIWETADEQVKAFTGTTEQTKRFADQVYALAAETQAKIQADAYDGMKDTEEVMLYDVQAMADKLKGIVSDTSSAISRVQQQMETFQGGVKRPGSSEMTAFGQRFVVTPDGRQIAIGAHGELPDNFDQMYGGVGNFSSGTSNQQRIGTGFNVPQFATGGVGDFGSGTLAMLHGLEAIVPLDRNPQDVRATALPDLGGVALGPETSGSVVINLYVTQPLGTPQQIADVVGKAIMGNLRGQGMRLPAGS